MCVFLNSKALSLSLVLAQSAFWINDEKMNENRPTHFVSTYGPSYRYPCLLLHHHHQHHQHIPIIIIINNKYTTFFQ